jgi:hypothetical protein
MIFLASAWVAIALQDDILWSMAIDMEVHTYITTDTTHQSDFSRNSPALTTILTFGGLKTFIDIDR